MKAMILLAAVLAISQPVMVRADVTIAPLVYGVPPNAAPPCDGVVIHAVSGDYPLEVGHMLHDLFTQYVDAKGNPMAADGGGVMPSAPGATLRYAEVGGGADIPPDAVKLTNCHPVTVERYAGGKEYKEVVLVLDNTVENLPRAQEQAIEDFLTLTGLSSASVGNAAAGLVQAPLSPCGILVTGILTGSVGRHSPEFDWSIIDGQVQNLCRPLQ